MNFNTKGSILSLSILIMVGCSSPSFYPIKQDKKQNNGICETTPKWAIQPPVVKGKIYGIGIAPQNFNGEAAQRKSAFSKAINEIASQLNTVVNSKIATNSVIYNKSATHSMSSVSFQTVNGQKVSAKMIKSCTNPNNGFLYILMEADK